MPQNININESITSSTPQQLSTTNKKLDSPTSTAEDVGVECDGFDRW